MKNSGNHKGHTLYAEAHRYYKNAKDTLRRSPIKGNAYQDMKYVQEACGTAYLAVLNALNGYLVERGMDPKKLPDSIEEYHAAFKKYLVHNGKVKGALSNVYEILHVFGYYKGFSTVDVVKIGFEKAKFLIEHLTRQKLG